MSDAPIPLPMPAGIAKFLNRPAPAGRVARISTRKKWVMPPAGLTAVTRAVSDGCDTIGKIRTRRACRDLTDNQIRKALTALRTDGRLTVEGRRYIWVA